MEGLKHVANRVDKFEEKLIKVQARDSVLKSVDWIDYEKLQASIERISSLGETILVLVKKLDGVAK